MSQPLIFITGATGFIGSHVVSQALEADYRVRLSVRKESQASKLKQLFEKHAAKLDFVVIPDLAKPGAFNQTLRDTDYVFHIASPMPGRGNDFKTDYLAPAEQGTIALLDTAKSIPTIKRIVIVSSILALVPLDVWVTGNFNVKEGSNASIPVDRDMEFPQDPQASAGLKYQASKILAHRSVLEWAPKNKPGFTIVTLHPSFVFGRNLNQTSEDGIDGSNAMLWNSLFSEKPAVPLVAVDVRDVALAHLRALNVDFKEQTAVQEFVLSAPEPVRWDWEHVVEFGREKYPQLNIKLKGPFDKPAKPGANRATELLGIQWRSMEDTVANFLDHQLELKAQL
ncbi:NAD dependent epimerase/dehydratase [Colletotrichum graminicola M1.001]|uniref:NAD dependent epimerase/dehydratase n=1 Tax=Colletotrichum graminicola (strain M1.001 / M2 / FGSC 10212) TaxID=645133 RepID=E3Q5I3_COLGM|nr:NAD dependent epimerase/dehydratase [Colletotrichum graminicola M1.001]EFQ25950.1 NAD dependent epimerase/dehydratase [Colletotrichum graminicola M1.001]